MARISPMMAQYHRIKEQCKDAILLFRMGDFYETFGDDARTTAQVLNITLTSRQKDKDGQKIPLAGIPYHALEAYLPKLVRAGYKVAICEQVEDPKKAKGVVKRELIRIITPGTIIEPSMLEDGSNNFLASAIKDGEFLGIAFLDVSTGEFLTTEIPSSEGAKKLPSELAKFRPAECVVPQSFDQDLRYLIEDFENTVVQTLEDDCFDFDGALQRILKHFGQDVLNQSEIEEKPSSVKACGAILSYLESMHLEALDHISSVRLYSSSEFMILDDVSQRNLELFRNIRDRSKRGTLLEFLDETSTPMGSRTLRQWLQMPVLSMTEIESRLGAVEELFDQSLLRSDIIDGLKGLGDLERLIARTSCGTASPKDLVSLGLSMERLPKICHVMEGVCATRLKDISSRLNLGELITVKELIDRALLEDPPTSIREGGIVRQGYDQELDELRTILREGRGWITRLQNDERKKTGIKSLKVGYNNVFGYYIEVTKANLSSVPEEYVRKQTLANAERFITPELKDMEAKVLSAQERSAALEQEIFIKIRSDVAKYAKEIQKRAVALGELDVLSTFALVASENGFVKPQLNDEGSIAIRDSRHPVLDKSMRGGFVPNDISLGGKDNRFLILTGPNMAGKSTYMRQIALCVILAHMGSFVPASFASIGLVDRIFTRVGAYDDLSAGQSTFMVEMSELANILNSATPQSLILLDEIGRGTSTFDGLSIAWAISEFLHDKTKAKTVFATHYHQLTQLAEILSGVKNYNMAVKEDGDSVVFLRTVVPGATNKSYGIHVAKLAGVPAEVVTRAGAILKAIERETVIEPLNDGSKSKKKTHKYTQLMFFDTPQNSDPANNGTDPLVEELGELDLNSMSPIGALNKLEEYQKRLRERDDAQDKGT